MPLARLETCRVVSPSQSAFISSKKGCRILTGHQVDNLARIGITLLFPILLLGRFIFDLFLAANHARSVFTSESLVIDCRLGISFISLTLNMKVRSTYDEFGLDSDSRSSTVPEVQQIRDSLSVSL